jgi:6-phospho-beta-glucosidase
MKIAVIGGGGVRTPQLVETLTHWAGRIHLECLSLMDTNPHKLQVIGGLCQEIARTSGLPFEVQCTQRAEEALEGASFIITTLRVGEEAGRILDERIALDCGVLGQETTGAGGFAMALRSIPAILDYARLAQEICPQAWILNFTNPAGLVTQALQNQGYERSVGICDSANNARKEAASWLHLPVSGISDQVFGLNHLSWTRSLNYQGREMLPGLLADDGFLASSRLRLFDPALVRRLGMYLNEYLYYYYYHDLVLKEISQRGATRGEQIAERSRRLLEELAQIDMQNQAAEGLKIYGAYRKKRSASYMNYGSGSHSLRAGQDAAGEREIRTSTEQRQSQAGQAEGPDGGGDEGYAGVALEVIAALEGVSPSYTALNSRNRGAIDVMHQADVVEVSCLVNATGVHPQPVGAIPEHQELLMRSVKRYERLCVDAVRTRSKALAVEALMSHPLVGSYALASRLVERYLAVHAAYTGVWNG